MSEAQEISIAQESDPQIKQEMGVYNDPALQEYVSDDRDEAWRRFRSGRICRGASRWWTCRRSTRSRVPGGYIYITRGILPFLDNEAELAGVLGHEIGHVTARHSAQQYTRQVGGPGGPGGARHLRARRAAVRRAHGAGARRPLPEVRPRRRAAGRRARARGTSPRSGGTRRRCRRSSRRWDVSTKPPAIAAACRTGCPRIRIR